MIHDKLIQAGKDVKRDDRLKNLQDIYGSKGGSNTMLKQVEPYIEGGNHGVLELLNKVDQYLEAIGCEIEIKKK
jgi:hypothetical protein